MEKRKILKMHVTGTFFCIVLGTLLHFLYEISGNNNIVGVFSAVNESTWEHLKLLFWPFILFAVIEFFVYGKDVYNFFISKLVSVIIGMVSIITLFYTYSGVIGNEFLIIDIIIFIIACITSYLLSYRFIKRASFNFNFSLLIGILGLVVLITLFAVFTFNAPDIGLFISPTD